MFRYLLLWGVFWGTLVLVQAQRDQDIPAVKPQIQEDSHAITFKSLLEEMINRDAITRYPEPYYTLKQFSSYDRRSTAINDSTWFANMDCNEFLRIEEVEGRKESVLMDAKGAGAIVRFWITGNNHGAGTLRIYLDGKSKPVVETKLLEFISKNEVGYPLSSSVSPETNYMRRGHNLYLPIPYSKSCKVTYEYNLNGDEWLYYCINARSYQEGTNIESFTMDAIDKNKTLLEKVNRSLNTINVAKTNDTTFDISHAKGKRVELKFDKKGQAITSIVIKVNGADLKRALRDIIMHASFDGNQTVWCPIGDFFGTGYEMHPSETYYSKVEKDGTMSVSWIMPYKKNCRISFENTGQTDYQISGAITTQSYQWTHNSMYFHASWQQHTALSTGGNKARIGYGGCFDLNFVTLRGKGVFVGDGIALFNTSLGGHWKSWWGEGDEKIYLDDEVFPSIIGTGTEDYYGYAWCEYASFNHPFLSQPIGGGNFKFDMTVNMRYRSLDAMPFSKSLKYDMEMWHWIKTKINFAPVTFYYMLPGGTKNVEPDYPGAQAKLAFDRFDILEPRAEDGILEGENMRVIGNAENTLGYYHDAVSGGVGMMWTKASVGDGRTFEFQADETAQLKRLALTSSSKNGIFEITLNGNKIVSWDSSTSQDFPALIDFVHKPLEQNNKLVVKLVSKNDQDKNSDIVIDYLLISENNRPGN
jgi:hypothetical protein